MRRVKTKDNKRTLLRLSTEAGEIAGNKAVYLVYVPECDQEKCVLKGICVEYIHKGRCTLEARFLKSIYKTWVDPITGIGDVLSQPQLFRIGAHIMPLYSMLIRLQKEYWALSNLTFVDKQNKISVTGLTKEIRETMRSLGTELRESGIEKVWEKKWAGNKMIPIPPSPGELIKSKFGNVNRYADLAKAKEEEEQAKELEEWEDSDEAKDLPFEK